MLVKPNECKGCRLYGNGKGFIQAEGLNRLGVYIVGEAGGENEEKDGKPFRPYAQAGSKLEEIFRLTGNSRDNFKILNVVNCKPPNNKLEHTSYELPAIEHCKVHLERSIKPNKKNIIFALGNTAFKALTHYSGEKKESVTFMRGYIFESKYGYVVPSFHPSFIKRGKPSYTPYLMYDLAKAVKLARLQDSKSQEYLTESEGKQNALANYNEFPSYDDIRSFYYKVKDSGNLMLSYDIETEDSPDTSEDERELLGNSVITQIQFSIEKGKAIAFPFTEEYLPFVRLLFLTQNEKIGHNSFNFDNPRLRDKAIKIKGRLHDSMFAFKQWNPGLLRNLQSVASLFNYPTPWKHLFTSQLRWYGCCDVDSIQYIFPRLKELMVKEGIWQGYLDHVVDFFPILQAASQKGIPVNDERRNRLKGYLEQERLKIDNEIQRLVPNHLKLLSPKVKDKESKEVLRTGYKKTPKIIKTEWLRYSQLKQQWQDRHLTSETYPLTFAEYLKERVQEIKDKEGKIKDRFTYVCKPEKITTNGNEVYYGVWHKQHYFKPSKEQLSSYIEWKHRTLANSEDKQERRLAKLYVVPTKMGKKGEAEKATTGEKALRELLEKTYDEVIRLIIGDKDYETDQLINRVGIRSIDTNINNFIKNWKPRQDGCVHTQFGMTAASGQLDSRAPNILNCSKHTVTGQLFRRIIEAPQNHVFIEFDFRSFHVATMGYCAIDKDYIRFSQLDPHSFFTAYYVKDRDLPLPRLDMADAEILDICKRYKNKYPEQRQHVSKVIVLGNQLGLGARKIYLQNKKYFNSINDAQEKQNILNDLFNKVAKFKNNIRALAHKQTKLVNDWGYLQRFYEVFAWKWDYFSKTLVKTQGSESEKAIAFPVQSTAFGKIRYDLLKMNQLGYLDRYNFCNSIHDSVMFMPHVSVVDECLVNVRNILTAPCDRLVNTATFDTGGLRVGVEASMGRNWQYYNDKDNPEGMKEVKLATN